MHRWIASLFVRIPLQFRVLYRQFLLRVVDLEALSIEADIPRFLGQFAGILIMISAAKFVGTLFMPPPPQLALVVEQGQIENMLLVIGFIAVVSWDATFPDRRDVMVLAPLPVRPLTILMAKLTASEALFGLAIVSLNFASSIAYALVLSGGRVLRFFAAYWFVMIAAGLLLHGSVVAVQGITALTLPRRVFLQLSAVLQLAAYALFLGAYFLLPTLPTWARVLEPRNHWLAAWSPVLWLLAMLNQLNGALPREAAWVAWRGWSALSLAVIGGFAALALCYLRTMKKTVEEPDLVPGARGLHWAPRLGSALQTAIVLFSLRSLARSKQHRVLFAFYLSLVFAISLSWIRADFDNPAPGAMPLDFLMSTLMIMCFAVFGLRGVFSLPVSLNANWILRVAQLQPTEKYIGATRLCLTLFGASPAWALSGALSLVFRPWHEVAGHLALLALLGWLLVEVGMLKFEKVPFTCSVLPGKTNVQFVFWGFVIVMMTLAFTGAQAELEVLHDLGRYIIAVAMLAGTAMGLWVFNHQRAKTAVLYFEEMPPEVITTLGISSWQPMLPQGQNGIRQ